MGSSEGRLSVPETLLALSHCPTEQSSGCFPISPEIKSSRLSSSRVTSFYSLNGGLHLLSFERPSSPTTQQWSSLSYLPIFSCWHLPILQITHLALVCLSPPNELQKPGDLTGLVPTVPSKPTRAGSQNDHS